MNDQLIIDLLFGYTVKCWMVGISYSENCGLGNKGVSLGVTK